MNMDTMSLWLVGGLILLTSEMLTASFFLIFVAIGCFAAALTASLGAPVWAQVTTSAVIAVAGTVTLRKPILKRFAKTMKLETDIGKEIRADEAIGPHQQARIKYQGSTWQATNLGSEKIAPGDHVTIVGVDGNVLLLRKND